MIFSISDNAGGKEVRKRAALQVSYWFLNRKETGKVPKITYLQNAQLSPCFGANVEIRSIVVSCFSKGRKIPLAGKAVGWVAHRTPRNLAVTKVSCCSVWNLSVEESTPRAPRMLQHEWAMVKDFFIDPDAPKGLRRPGAGCILSNCYQSFLSGRVWSFLPRHSSVPSTNMLVCVQTPWNVIWNSFIWLKFKECKNLRKNLETRGTKIRIYSKVYLSFTFFI